MKVRWSYLPQQFSDPDEILAGIREIVITGGFTLGDAVAEFEAKYASLIGSKHAIGVGSGTDAIMLPLRVLGVGHGDEVITAANTFVATVAAINAVGARPILVDITPNYVMNAELVEAAITSRTKAIVPVHFAGEPADMTAIMEVAERHNLPVVEDACQGILAACSGRTVGTFGVAGAYSLHPLKNLNVWGDAGIIVTDSDDMAASLRMYRNYGLSSRDEIEVLGYNSRLDTIQAVVGNWLVEQVPGITNQRVENAARYDAGFRDLEGKISLPPVRDNVERVYHLYMIRAERRDELVRHLLDHEISAKVHYPIPLHLQKGLSFLGYTKGDFPENERQAASLVSLPVDQHLSEEEIDYVIKEVRSFYAA